MELVCDHCGEKIGELRIGADFYGYIHHPERGENAYIWCTPDLKTSASAKKLENQHMLNKMDL